MGPIHIHRGFTLIEILVSLAIIMIISAVVITSHSTFNKTLILQNTAYDIALTLRTAETYGLGSRGNNASTNTGYGIQFTSTPNDSFILFADTYPIRSTCHQLPANDPTGPDAKPGDCAFNNNNGEWNTMYSLGNGMTIEDFCVFNSNTWQCKSSQTPNNLTSLDIVFLRPNSDTFMSANNTYNYQNSKACIKVVSPQGGARFITVSKSGQIIANAPSDNNSCH